MDYYHSSLCETIQDPVPIPIQVQRLPQMLVWKTFNGVKQSPEAVGWFGRGSGADECMLMPVTDLGWMDTKCVKSDDAGKCRLVGR